MIVIGAAGHRVLADPVGVREAVDEAVSRIQERHPAHEITVMSALAEGADRIIAQAVLARPHARLKAVLPFPAEQYLHDFPSASSRAEFDALLALADEIVVLAPQPSREAAYQAAASYVLIHSDILMTVWDGGQAQGRGGTGETVARARAMGLPLAWVKAGNRIPGTMTPTSLADEAGHVIFENI